MSYQVLARKWRPRAFDEMVGQEHVLRALTNALSNQRLHHAYLFTGTRGVGKTTLARILAKCLNCEQGITPTPCGHCDACQTIGQGRFVDLIEVDAASRTKVEDTRELLDNVQYAPTAGRYKIYLIDEVHMLSGHSFNALLKTLEEPPEHVIFLLATTDPQRLPVTVLSRCLQFHLKNLSIDCIAGHLQHVLGEEKIQSEPPALRQLARAGNGSLRDALSLLDQAIAFGNGQVMATDVSSMLGTMERNDVARLLDSLIEKDGGALLAYTKQLAEKGLDYDEVLAALTTLLHVIALYQAVPDAEGDHDYSQEQIAAWAGALTAEEVQLLYQIALIGRRDLPLAPDPKTGFEMALLRMLAFSLAPPSASTPSSKPTGKRQKSEPASRPQQTTSQVTVHRDTQAPVGAAPCGRPGRHGGLPLQMERECLPAEALPDKALTFVNQKGDTLTSQDWPTLVKKLPLTGRTKMIVDNCVLTEASQTHIHLNLDEKHAAMLNKDQEATIAEALEKALGKTYQLEITVAAVTQETPADQTARKQEAQRNEAVANLQEDNTVQALQNALGAQLDPSSAKLITT